MSEFVRHLGETLRRYYGAVVNRPMPWKMIDKLASLEESSEADIDMRRSAPDEAADRVRGPREPDHRD